MSFLEYNSEGIQRIEWNAVTTCVLTFNINMHIIMMKNRNRMFYAIIYP